MSAKVEKMWKQNKFLNDYELTKISQLCATVNVSDS